MLRLVLACLALCFSYNIALAKYCVKLPSCEELGYVFPYKEGRRQIRCPFDTDKALYLDYCQAYGIQGKPDETAGEYQECIEEKADGTKINTGYYRYTRCNVGYRYESGHCVRYSCNTPHTCLVGDVYLHDNEPIGVVFYDDGTVTKIVALKDINASGNESDDENIRWSTDENGIYSYTTGNTHCNNTPDLCVNDTDGKKNTKTILSYIASKGYIAESATATSLYAPQICTNSSFCGQGEWYLPALGELQSIYNNFNSIQTALGRTRGTKIRTMYYWSSTEQIASHAWDFNFSTGYKAGHAKSSSWHRIRPTLSF